jgi:hypothetical protein
MPNVIRLKINNGNKNIFDEQLSINESIITINDNFVLSILRPFNINKDSIKYCYFTFGLANAFVDIINYTLTDEIYIDGFFNQPSYIAVLRCINTKLHIVDQHIKNMQIDGDSILIANCNIDEIDIGLNKQMKALTYNDIIDTEMHIKKIDIRSSVVREIKLFASCDSVNIQESEIKIVRFDCRFGTTKDRFIDMINIWRNCTINTVEISCQINVLKISESTVYALISKSKCKIDTLNIDQSIINTAYNFDLNNFRNLNTHSWHIISKSASSSHNLELRAKANYNIANTYMKEKTLIYKIPMMFFKITTGYGYKPFRIIWFSLINIIVFGCIFFFLDNLTHILNICDIILTTDAFIKIIDSLMENIFYSLGYFVGLSSNSSLNTKYILALLENIIGVVTFAMFVNALYVKYKD